jgi:hypothetical protein
VDTLQAILLAERLKRSGKPLSPEEMRYLDSARKCLKCNMEDKIKGILASFNDSSPESEQ